MAEVINMPKLGFDMQEGQLINWVKKPGDVVKHGDVLAEIESDKATIEVEAFVEGVMLEHLVPVGEWVPIGAPIAIIGQKGEAVDRAALGLQQAEAGANSTPEPSAALSPARVGEASEPRQESGQAPAMAPKPAGQRQNQPGGNGHSEMNGRDLPEGVRASPLARRIASDRGVDLAQVAGSGPNGRIVRADVESYRQALAEAPAAPRTAAHAPIQPQEGDQSIDTPRMRKRIGQRMVESKTTVPHFYVTTTIDMGPALDLRKEINRRLEQEGTKISVNDMIVKAVALAMREFPNLNSSFNGDTIIRHQHINVGIAVALDDGLINVVSKDADKTPLAVQAKHHLGMIERAREGKIKPEDVEGETIAVSNLGPWDVDHFIAIINPPAAAIIAVGSAAQVPIVLEDGTLGVGWRMKATISADHRVTDGAEAAKFMQRVKQILEDPLRLLM